MSNKLSGHPVTTLPTGTAHDGISELQDCDVILVEEFDAVRADLKRKQCAASARRHRQQKTNSSPLFGTDVPMPLSSDDKTALAISVSAATSLPGAYTGYGNDNGGPKPSQDQLMEVARQRDRQNGQLQGLEPYEADTDDFLDDLQSRMNGSSAQDNGKKLQLRRKQRRRNMIVVGALVVVLVGAVVIGTTWKQRSNSNDRVGSDGSQSSADVFSDPCVSHAALTGEVMTERYMQLRATIDTQFPSITTDIDIPRSAHRLALCWMSDLDGLQVDTESASGLIQRFVLSLVYFHFVMHAKDEGIIKIELSNLDWISDVHECDWNFIVCDADREVKGLELSRLDLKGTIPSELSLLSSLENIDLLSNRLTGTVPSELWGLPQLTRLHLASNQLNGAIFEGARRLPTLVYLGARDNLFTGTLPESWDMPNLELFTVSINAFEGAFPDFAAMTKLSHLDLGCTDLTGTIPDYLWTLTALNHLDIGYTYLSGSIPTRAGLLNELEVLDLKARHMTGTVPSELGQLSKLEYLGFFSNQMSGTIPAEVCDLSKCVGGNLIITILDTLLTCDCCG